MTEALVKTTFLEAIHHALGSYAGNFPSDDLILKHNSKPDERRAVNLVGLRFTSANETLDGSTLDENFIKQISGGDTVAGRYLYKEKFDFKPQAKFWLRTNHLPKIRSTDDGIWRRITTIPFGHLVKKKDRELPKKLKKERDGILAWIMRGLIEYVENGELYIAPRIRQDIATYRSEQNNVAQFVEEECELGKSFDCEKHPLFITYKMWAENRKYFVKNELDFGKELTKGRAIIDTRKRTDAGRLRMWVGIRMRP